MLTSKNVCIKTKWPTIWVLNIEEHIKRVARLDLTRELLTKTGKFFDISLTALFESDSNFTTLNYRWLDIEHRGPLVHIFVIVHRIESRKKRTKIVSHYHIYYSDIGHILTPKSRYTSDDDSLLSKPSMTVKAPIPVSGLLPILKIRPTRNTLTTVNKV